MTSPRRRLRALRAIPDHDRTDEQWDELNELEIMLAPANRVAPFSANERTAEHQARSRPSRPSGVRANGNRAPAGRAANSRSNGNAGAQANAKKGQGTRGNGGNPQAAASAPHPNGAPRRKPTKRPRKRPRNAGPAEGA